MISVPSVPVGPFGHDLRYGRVVWTVNAVIHQLHTDTSDRIHELPGAVDNPVDDAFGHPPIANISIFGSVDVAADRSSEYRSSRPRHTSATNERRSASDEPSRKTARRSCPVTANRHVYNCPSADSLARVHRTERHRHGGDDPELAGPSR